MTELGYPIQSCDITGSIDVYYADDVIFLLDEKDKRIAELEKTLREFEHAVRNENELLEMQKNQDVRDLEQQAKGVELFIKSEAEWLQKAPWFKDSQPTLEYLYDADFGLSTCSSGVKFAENLRNKAKALKEQGE